MDRKFRPVKPLKKNTKITIDFNALGGRDTLDTKGLSGVESCHSNDGENRATEVGHEWKRM